MRLEPQARHPIAGPCPDADLLHQTEVMVGTWIGAKAEDPGLTEADVREVCTARGQ